VLSDSNARLVAARKLTSRRARRETGRFLVEGAQGVREALRRPELVVALFATPAAAQRHPELIAAARSAEVAVDEISDRAAAALSETVTTQGLVAVCRTLDVGLDAVLAAGPRLIAALVETSDPGNAGTVLRTADAAGADALVLTGGVDPYNGKAVRASAGSLFHLDVVQAGEPIALIEQARRAGLRSLATTGSGDADLDELIDSGELARPSLWLFGGEAHGLPADVLAAADVRVRIPIHGAAESLNLAAAAAICLYASARSQRRPVVTSPKLPR
jgi:TrmH family RNA methyltransferase